MSYTAKTPDHPVSRLAALLRGTALAAMSLLAAQAAQAGRCPDPAVTDMRISAIRFDGSQPVVSIKVTVRNLGARDFVSSPGQQMVEIFAGPVSRRSTVLARRDFTRLRARQGFSLGAQYRPGGDEFTSDLIARLQYDPDISQDSNPRNDDCNLANNRAVLAASVINAAVARARHMPALPRPLPLPLPTPLPLPWHP